MRNREITGLEMKREGSMHLVPAPAVRLMKSRVTSRPGNKVYNLEKKSLGSSMNAFIMVVNDVDLDEPTWMKGNIFNRDPTVIKVCLSSLSNEQKTDVETLVSDSPS